MKIIIRSACLVGAVFLNACTTTGPTADLERAFSQPVKSYKKMAKKSWAPIEYSSKAKPGKKAKSISLVRERLVDLGDLKDNSLTERDDVTNYFDETMERALKQFQARHGLAANGRLNRQTISALNISPVQRLMQINKNIARLSEFGSDKPKRYIHINIPSYSLKVIEEDQTVLSMRVIVGNQKWPTPEMKTVLKTVVFNPHWNVPESITEKEIVHKMVEDPEYLTKHNIKIFSSWKKDDAPIDPATINWSDYTGEKNLPYRLAQGPGDENALGRLKFTIVNDDNIYLHDTAHPSLFSLDKRALSHGCIRLSNPLALMRYLTKDHPRVSDEKIDAWFKKGKTKHIAVMEDIPVYITYHTSWLDGNGQVQFREDIYHKDMEQVDAPMLTELNGSVVD